MQSSPESGERAGADGHTRRTGSTVHRAGDGAPSGPGHVLALRVPPANAPDRKPVAERVQKATGESVAVACGDQGDTGEQPADEAAEHGIRREVVTLPTAQRGFVLLPCRWVGERSNAGMARFCRPARDAERRPETVAGVPFLAFAILMAQRFIAFMVQST
jgi:transposase